MRQMMSVGVSHKYDFWGRSADSYRARGAVALCLRQSLHIGQSGTFSHAQTNQSSQSLIREGGRAALVWMEQGQGRVSLTMERHEQRESVIVSKKSKSAEPPSLGQLHNFTAISLRATGRGEGVVVLVEARLGNYVVFMWHSEGTIAFSSPNVGKPTLTAKRKQVEVALHPSLTALAHGESSSNYDARTIKPTHTRKSNGSSLSMLRGAHRT